MGIWWEYGKGPGFPGTGVSAPRNVARKRMGFQTRAHLPARTDDLFMSVMIRGLRAVNLVLCLRIRTDSDA